MNIRIRFNLEESEKPQRDLDIGTRYTRWGYRNVWEAWERGNESEDSIVGLGSSEEEAITNLVTETEEAE